MRKNITKLCIMVLATSLLLTGCGGNDEVKQVLNQTQATIDNLLKQNKELREENSDLQHEIADLRETKGKGAQAATGFWILIIAAIIGVALWLYSHRRKNFQKQISQLESDKEKMRLSEADLKETISQLKNDIERFKQLIEEGEKNQVVSQLKVTQLRRDRITKEIKELHHGSN